MYGSHLSIAGGLQNALLEAKQLGMDCVQVFTKNQRQWRVPPLTDEQVRLWQDARRETGITQVVSHDSYLINLANPTKEAWDKSIALFREELTRCEALEIADLVAHPGAHMGKGEEAGLKRIAHGLDRLHQDLPGLKVRTCLELTAGQGSNLGADFEHLRRIIDLVQDPDRLAVCLDTAHVLEAGYDLTSAAGCRTVLAELDDVIGLEKVRVLHLNDSKTARGSRVDRHEHIGKGHVSLDAFKVIVRKPCFKTVPKILETPKDGDSDGRPWDLVNLDVLKGLASRSSTSPDNKEAAKKPARSPRKAFKQVT